MREIILDIFFDDNLVYSRTFKRIMSNPSDKIKYLEAVEKLENGSKEETIELETVGKITIIQASFRFTKF